MTSKVSLGSCAKVAQRCSRCGSSINPCANSSWSQLPVPPSVSIQ